MPTETTSASQAKRNDLRTFYEFVGDKLRADNSELLPEDVWKEWQLSHSDEQDDEDDVQAIRESIDAMRAGEPAKSVEQFERDFRARHGLPPRT